MKLSMFALGLLLLNGCGSAPEEPTVWRIARLVPEQLDSAVRTDRIGLSLEGDWAGISEASIALLHRGLWLEREQTGERIPVGREVTYGEFERLLRLVPQERLTAGWYVLRLASERDLGVTVYAGLAPEATVRQAATRFHVGARPRFNAAKACARPQWGEQACPGGDVVLFLSEASDMVQGELGDIIRVTDGRSQCDDVPDRRGNRISLYCANLDPERTWTLRVERGLVSVSNGAPEGPTLAPVITESGQERFEVKLDPHACTDRLLDDL